MGCTSGALENHAVKIKALFFQPQETAMNSGGRGKGEYLTVLTHRPHILVTLFNYSTIRRTKGLVQTRHYLKSVPAANTDILTEHY